MLVYQRVNTSHNYCKPGIFAFQTGMFEQPFHARDKVKEHATSKSLAHCLRPDTQRNHFWTMQHSSNWEFQATWVFFECGLIDTYPPACIHVWDAFKQHNLLKAWFQMVTSTTAALSSSSFRISCIVRPQTWLESASRNSFRSALRQKPSIPKRGKKSCGRSSRTMHLVHSSHRFRTWLFRPDMAGLSHVSDLSSLCLASHDLCEGAATEPPSIFYIYQYPAVIKKISLIFTHL
jgi:hypothetical protein